MMKYKQGGMWLISTLCGYIIYSVLGHYEPQIINAFLNLSGVSLVLLVNLAFLGLSAFGVFLILKEKYGWLKKNRAVEKPEYNPKFLNDNVFRKLMRVKHSTNYKGELIFEIPTDERAFRPRTSNTYSSWIAAKIAGFREDHHDAIDYVSIEQAIPNLKIGEKYLQSNYKEVYEMWLEVKTILEKHNEHRQNFKKQLGEIAIEKLKKGFPTFDLGQIDQPLQNDAYFVDKIQNFLFNTIGHNLRDPEHDALSSLHIGWTGNTIYTLQSNSLDVLMASLDQKKIDVDKARLIFREIITENENIESFRKSVEIEPTFYDKIERFSEKLEDDVVNEIDALRLS